MPPNVRPEAARLSYPLAVMGAWVRQREGNTKEASGVMPTMALVLEGAVWAFPQVRTLSEDESGGAQMGH